MLAAGLLFPILVFATEVTDSKSLPLASRSHPAETVRQPKYGRKDSRLDKQNWQNIYNILQKLWQDQRYASLAKRIGLRPPIGKDQGNIGAKPKKSPFKSHGLRPAATTTGLFKPASTTVGVPSTVSSSAAKGREYSSLHLVESIRLSQGQSLDECLVPMPPASDAGSAVRVLEDDYWLKRVNELYEAIIQVLAKLRGGRKLRGRKLRLLKDAMTAVLKEIRQQLSHLSRDELIRLFWKIHEALMRGDITPDGKIIIDGEKYDIDDILAYCCPFG